MSDILRLGGVDVKKLLKGLIIAVVGAGLTYLSEWITGQDFGQLTPMIVAGFAFLANLVRKLLTSTGV